MKSLFIEMNREKKVQFADDKFESRHSSANLKQKGKEKANSNRNITTYRL